MSGDAVKRELAILRRYLSYPNMDSYRADPVTCSPIEGSFQPRVTHSQAHDALHAIEQAARARGSHD